jgi:thiamine pyrophosphate-dependent acetolactate synthase large subunit-like protein
MTGRIDRRDLVARLVARRAEALLVTGLGSPTWDVAAAGDGALNFYLWGGMGGAAAVGLGLALAEPGRRVVVVTGDGEMLMGLGSLATIAAQAAPNLGILVLDNEAFGETGGQPSHTGKGVDLSAMALGAGFRSAQTVSEPSEIDQAISDLLESPGPVLVAAKVSREPAPLALPPKDAVLLKHRLRQALAVPSF